MGIYTEFRGFKVHLLVPVLIVFLLPVLVVVVVVYGGPHEDTLLIERCQWFDPS